MKCDCCGNELSDNNRLNSDLNFGNGSQFSDGYTICGDCAKIVHNFVKELKTKLRIQPKKEK